MARDLTISSTLRAPQGLIRTKLGAVSYIWIDITEATGKDISALPPWQIAIGTKDAPGSWFTALETVSDPGVPGKVSLGFLVGGTNLTPAAGTYTGWINAVDDPEVFIQPVDSGSFTVDGPPLNTVVDNLDGTVSLIGVTDNGDGTLNISNATVLGDGTLTIG